MKFCSHNKFEVEDGSKVRFWHDLWCGDMALKDAFQFYLVLGCFSSSSSIIFWRCYLVKHELC